MPLWQQDRTRLECKLALDEISTPCAVDRIEPDWNVNEEWAGLAGEELEIE